MGETREKLQQFGGGAGGPLIKDKLFWFMSYEGTKQNQFATTPNLTLPTAAMRTGDFSGTGVVIYDPLTGNADGTGRTPFVGNVIPSNDPIGLPQAPHEIVI